MLIFSCIFGDASINVITFRISNEDIIKGASNDLHVILQTNIFEINIKYLLEFLTLLYYFIHQIDAPQDLKTSTGSHMASRSSKSSRTSTSWPSISGKKRKKKWAKREKSTSTLKHVKRDAERPTNGTHSTSF